ncbi:MAG: carbohydrate-binding protein [Firmicutes bacterium]|nr:carbohydrate-binding protein [Bacillota bacterium]
MEASVELVGRDLSRDYQLAPDDGIIVRPTPVSLGDELQVEYRGLLAQSGAEEVYLHYGFGRSDWTYVQDIPMEKSADGTWTAVVQVEEAGRFNFCFRDNANNWDNNYGRNWSYEIHGDGDFH